MATTSPTMAPIYERCRTTSATAIQAHIYGGRPAASHRSAVAVLTPPSAIPSLRLGNVAPRCRLDASKIVAHARALGLGIEA